MWYTGYNPYTLEPVFSAKTPEEKKAQNQYFFWYKDQPQSSQRPQGSGRPSSQRPQGSGRSQSSQNAQRPQRSQSSPKPANTPKAPPHRKFKR